MGDEIDDFLLLMGALQDAEDVQEFGDLIDAAMLLSSNFEEKYDQEFPNSVFNAIPAGKIAENLMWRSVFFYWSNIQSAIKTLFRRYFLMILPAGNGLCSK